MRGGRCDKVSSPKECMNDKYYVDVSRICVGTEVKNYKAMCEVLGCVPCKGSGNDKRSQLRNWERYFRWRREGHKYIVTEIYDVPLPYVDGRSLREGVYLGHIEALTVRLLASCRNNRLYCLKNDLYAMLGFVNGNYEDLRLRHSDIIENAVRSGEMTSYDVDDFRIRTAAKLNKILFTALNSMQKRNIIDYRTEYVIFRSDPASHMLYKDTADVRETSIIEDAQAEILSQMDCHNMRDVLISGRIHEFNFKINSYLQESYDWHGVYSRIVLSYTSGNGEISPLRCTDIGNLTFSEIRRDLNRLIMDSLNEQAANRYRKKSYVPDGEFHYHRGYVEAQRDLADYLLNISFSDRFEDMWSTFDKEENFYIKGV